MGFLPGEVLMGYVKELEEQRRTIHKNRCPSLDDYDGGFYIWDRPTFTWDDIGLDDD